MGYPHEPQPREDFATWIRPLVDSGIDRVLSELRERIGAGRLLTQEEQLALVDQLIKDRAERAALIERGEGAVQ